MNDRGDLYVFSTDAGERINVQGGDVVVNVGGVGRTRIEAVG